MKRALVILILLLARGGDAFCSKGSARIRSQQPGTNSLPIAHY